MSYIKPELVVLGSSMRLVQNHVCKTSDHSDNPVPDSPIATATAYEADE
jgi:hypothetical protein